MPGAGGERRQGARRPLRAGRPARANNGSLLFTTPAPGPAAVRFVSGGGRLTGVDRGEQRNGVQERGAST